MKAGLGDGKAGRDDESGPACTEWRDGLPPLPDTEYLLAMTRPVIMSWLQVIYQAMRATIIRA